MVSGLGPLSMSDKRCVKPAVFKSMRQALMMRWVSPKLLGKCCVRPRQQTAVALA